MCDFECGFIRNVNYGYSTGICAAAASKASAIFQASGKIPDFVTVKNLENHEFNIRVFSEKGNFYVIKDSGDDRSDVTNGIKIFSHVEILADNDRKIFFSAGEGVGIVTLPGLKIPIGEPAINPIPRKIIENSLREIIPEKSLRVTISIPDGEKIALKTFNPRLGIK
ncbi:MAG: cobalt-precorrin-5B (C(1))-methyltransferase, partial [Synergistaceae bacterium]|nr:cobalt-precorrin-5B (C(1))-methyltransferase [Synergistaceae bacterium]